MSEVQFILIWLHDICKISDSEVAKYCGVSRETINRLRKGKTKGETGKSILPRLRKVALQFNMPEYHPVPESQPQSKKSAPAQSKKSTPAQSKKSAPAQAPVSQPTPVVTRSLARATMPIARDANKGVVNRPPVQPKPFQDVVRAKQHAPIQSYRIGETFLCVSCHLGVTAHDDGREKVCPHCTHPYQTSLDYARDYHIVSQHSPISKRTPPSFVRPVTKPRYHVVKNSTPYTIGSLSSIMSELFDD